MSPDANGIEEILAHPDPNPDLIPAIPSGFALQEQTATHLVRAILKGEASIERLKAAMQKDIQAWSHLIASAEARTEAWRALIRDWMIRNDVKQLKAPYATAFIQNGRRHLSWQEDDRIIGILDAMGATKAVSRKPVIVRKEFTVVYDSVPEKFKDLVKDEIGESALVIKEWS